MDRPRDLSRNESGDVRSIVTRLQRNREPIARPHPTSTSNVDRVTDVQDVGLVITFAKATDDTRRLFAGDRPPHGVSRSAG